MKAKPEKEMVMLLSVWLVELLLRRRGMAQRRKELGDT